MTGQDLACVAGGIVWVQDYSFGAEHWSKKRDSTTTQYRQLRRLGRIEAFNINNQERTKLQISVKVV